MPLDFPIILQKDSWVQLKCRIKWAPGTTYPGWIAAAPESDDHQALVGRIAGRYKEGEATPLSNHPTSEQRPAQSGGRSTTQRRRSAS